MSRIFLNMKFPKTALVAILATWAVIPTSQAATAPIKGVSDFSIEIACRASLEDAETKCRLSNAEVHCGKSARFHAELEAHEACERRGGKLDLKNMAFYKSALSFSRKPIREGVKISCRAQVTAACDSPY